MRHLVLAAVAGALGTAILTAVFLVLVPSTSRAGERLRASVVDPSPAIGPCARF